MFYSRISILTLTNLIYTIYLTLLLIPLGKTIGIYGGTFNVNFLNNSFSIFIIIITIIISILTGFYSRVLSISKLSGFFSKIYYKLVYNKSVISNKFSKQFNILEYALIMVFVITGGIFLMTSADLITIFLSIELQSYGLYIISALYRDSELSTGSALMYFLLGGLSSCFILLGSALLYTTTGTTNLENIYLIINISNNILDSKIINILYNIVNLDKLYYIQISIIVMICGFLFKISASPFHFWSPDVYDGIPTVVTTFVAIIAKISIFIYLLDFTLNTQNTLFDFNWTNILILSSLLSLLVGSILGLNQTRIKRLFAYSTISHLGFILLALSISTPESIQSYIFYILQYTISNLNGFIILLVIGYTLYSYTYSNKEILIDKNNSPVQLISQLKGYFYINSFIATSFSITIFSFVGIPPIIGFFAKQKVLSSALNSGYIFMSIIAVLTSVIAGAYYLNLIKTLYFSESDYNKNENVKIIKGNAYIEPHSDTVFKEDTVKRVEEREKVDFNINNIKINSGLSVVISSATLLMFAFIFEPSTINNLINLLSLNLFNE